MGLTIRRGDDEDILGEVFTREGVPVDISGWKIWFTVKRRWPDSDGNAVIAKTTGPDLIITNGPGGLFTVYIRNADFALIPNAERTNLFYDVQVRPVASTRVRTIDQGDFVVLGDITFATS